MAGAKDAIKKSAEKELQSPKMSGCIFGRVSPAQGFHSYFGSSPSQFFDARRVDQRL